MQPKVGDTVRAKLAIDDDIDIIILAGTVGVITAIYTSGQYNIAVSFERHGAYLCARSELQVKK